MSVGYRQNNTDLRFTIRSPVVSPAVHKPNRVRKSFGEFNIPIGMWVVQEEAYDVILGMNHGFEGSAELGTRTSLSGYLTVMKRWGHGAPLLV